MVLQLLKPKTKVGQNDSVSEFPKNFILDYLPPQSPFPHPEIMRIASSEVG